MRWTALLLCLTGSLLGCGGDETGAVPASACGPEVPAETWASFGRPFLTTYCQGCHASTAVDRAGAPEDVIFDTADDAYLHRDRILARAGAEPPTMPTQGGTSVDDRERLRLWVTCFGGR